MEELKNEDAHMGIANRILNIFLQDHPSNPYMLKDEAIYVLYPPLGKAKMEVRIKDAEQWFI